MLEQRPFKALVAGSSPGHPTLLRVSRGNVESGSFTDAPANSTKCLVRTGCEIAIGKLHTLLNASAVEFCHRVFRWTTNRELGRDEAIVLISPDVGRVDAAHELAGRRIFLDSHGDKPLGIDPTAYF